MITRLSRREFLGASFAGLVEYNRGGMVYRRMGQTGIDVSLLSFGSHTDPADRVRAGSGKTVLTAQGQARRDRIITRAFDLGVNLLDVYDSEGQWEPAARLVKDRREKVLISLAHDISASGVERACRLFSHVDLYRFHTAEIDARTLQDWDVLRKAKEAGKIRAIGISTHVERVMSVALEELEGIDFIFFPYNFIHARADYGQFLPQAARKNVGLVGMKPLASGSIARLDPNAPAVSAPEFSELQLWQTRNRPILPAAVAELTKSLDRMAGETLCMAALRFSFSRPFLATAIAGIFHEQWLEDDYKALSTYRERKPDERSALDAAARVARLRGPAWLPPHYRWLEEQWRA